MDLNKALSKMLGKEIINAEFETEQLSGGTVGDVKLLAGTAETKAGGRLPFKIVLKTQKRWERFADADSWRREYDFYLSDFGTLFNETLRWPKCYHAEMKDGEFDLWLEYAEGATGLDLTGDMYERAAYELGRLQGRLYAEKPETAENLANLGNINFLKENYLHYKNWEEQRAYLRAEDCEIPRHLRQMLFDIEEKEADVWARIEKLPIILCHRDFWVTNLIDGGGKIYLIDWDTAGWGYLGEDMASLIADEADVPRMVEYFGRCIPAYYKGFSEHADISCVEDNCVYELMLVMFGYRLAEWVKYAETAEDKALHIETLQKIYEIGCNNENRAIHRRAH